MRVLTLCGSDWKGGEAKVAYYLTQGLRARGMAADMLVAQKSTQTPWVAEINAPARAPKGPIRRRVDWRLSYNAALKLDAPGGAVAFAPERLAQYDLVHLHNVPPVSLWDVFRRLRKPLVWTVHSMAPLTGNCMFSLGCERWTQGCGQCPQHGSWPLIYQHRDASAEILWIKRALYRRMRFQAVGVSAWTTDQIARSVMGTQPRHTVQNPSWAPDFFPSDRQAARRALGIPEDAFAVMFSVSGNPMDTRKGLDIIRAALARMQSSWPDAGRLFLLPTGIIDPDEAMQEQLANIPGLPPRYLADTADLRRYYTAADVIWHPSRADTSSMVSLEAFGCGTPVIAAAVGGVPEIVIDGQSGLLIPSEDPNALMAATRRLMDTPALHADLRAGALTKAAAHHPDVFIDAYLDVYDQALAS